MKTRILILGALAGLAGCSTTPNYDARFGDAVRDSKLAMTLNPNASSNQDPVAGIDAAAAKEAHTRYIDSFKKPPEVINVINIGGAIGSKQ